MPEIDTMEAGPEMDALIESRVFDVACEELRAGIVVRLFTREPIPPYSTDIADAWDVAEYMRGQGFDVTVMTFAKGGAACEIARPKWRGSEYHEADTAPLAICRAALHAVEADHA